MSDVRVYALHGGGERVDMSIFDPFHPDVGTKVEVPYFFYVIAHPDGNVLFDTGGHVSVIDDPPAPPRDAPPHFEGAMKAGGDVGSQNDGDRAAPQDIAPCRLPPPP